MVWFRWFSGFQNWVICLVPWKNLPGCICKAFFEDIWRVEKRINHMNQGSSYCKRISEFYQQTSNRVGFNLFKKNRPLLLDRFLCPYYSHTTPIFESLKTWVPWYMNSMGSLPSGRPLIASPWNHSWITEPPTMVHFLSASILIPREDPRTHKFGSEVWSRWRTLPQTNLSLSNYTGTIEMFYAKTGGNLEINIYMFRYTYIYSYISVYIFFSVYIYIYLFVHKYRVHIYSNISVYTYIYINISVYI